MLMSFDDFFGGGGRWCGVACSVRRDGSWLSVVGRGGLGREQQSEKRRLLVRDDG